MRVLVTGVSGYVGGRLAPALLAAGHEIVGFARSATELPSGGTLVRGDLATGVGLHDALDEVEVAFYLAHAYQSGNDERFATRDRRMAECFAAAARRAGVRRIVHLIQRALGHPPRTVGVPRRLQAALGPVVARIGPADPTLLREMHRTGLADSVVRDDHLRRLGVSPRPITDAVHDAAAPLARPATRSAG